MERKTFFTLAFSLKIVLKKSMKSMVVLKVPYRLHGATLASNGNPQGHLGLTATQLKAGLKLPF